MGQSTLSFEQVVGMGRKEERLPPRTMMAPLPKLDIVRNSPPTHILWGRTPAKGRPLRADMNRLEVQGSVLTEVGLGYSRPLSFCLATSTFLRCA